MLTQNKQKQKESKKSVMFFFLLLSWTYQHTLLSKSRECFSGLLLCLETLQFSLQGLKMLLAYRKSPYTTP